MNLLWRHPGLVIADRWQRGFPLCANPFATVGAEHGLTAAETIESLAALQDRGILGRIGAVVRPNTAGASTLAALSCPPDDLDRVAAIVSAEPYVNHNYERSHSINLWFVVAAPCEDGLSRTLARIAEAAGSPVLDLRLQRAYHIDLGFGLAAAGSKPEARNSAGRCATAEERQLLAAIEDGLPLVARPFAAVARRLGWSEARVTELLAAMLRDGIITRFGCVIRHREVGFTANAMAVWDVPQDLVDGIGARLAAVDGVTLCYRRNRQAPGWPYNLFAMVHGREEEAVRHRIRRAITSCGLADFPHDVLFSRRCFTQRGARFAARGEAA